MLAKGFAHLVCDRSNTGSTHNCEAIISSLIDNGRSYGQSKIAKKKIFKHTVRPAISTAESPIARACIARLHFGLEFASEIQRCV